ncbi:MAG: CPBP family intramembrane glutamic endopeptidase, partial [Clostridium sp.]
LALLVRITNSIFASALLHFLINGTSVTLQQILLKIPNVNEVAGDVSIKAMPLGEKLMMLQMYLIPAVFSCALCALILIKMKKWSDERKGIYKPRYSLNPQVNSYIYGSETVENKVVQKEVEYSKERVINWPFITTIIVYIAYMAFNIIYTM